MRLRLNGNCKSARVARELRTDGHDVENEKEALELPRDERDLEIQRKAQKAGRIVITGNKRDWRRAEMRKVRTGGVIIVQQTRGQSYLPRDKDGNEWKVEQIRQQIAERGDELEKGAMTQCTWSGSKGRMETEILERAPERAHPNVPVRPGGAWQQTGGGGGRDRNGSGWAR